MVSSGPQGIFPSAPECGSLKARSNFQIVFGLQNPPPGTQPGESEPCAKAEKIVNGRIHWQVKDNPTEGEAGSDFALC